MLEKGFEVFALFYNPNIHPLKEYLKRKEAFLEVANYFGIKTLCLDKDYNLEDFFRLTSFREKNRCFYCYHLRLEKSFYIARRGRFDYFTSTLLYSKFQKHELIKSIGKDLAKEGKVQFLEHDFREGWEFGQEQSKKMGIYRQQYCGCIYSEFERYKRELEV